MDYLRAIRIGRRGEAGGKYEERGEIRWGKWSGREDLNLRPPGPEPGALARLRYAPTTALGHTQKQPEWNPKNNIARRSKPRSTPAGMPR